MKNSTFIIKISEDNSEIISAFGFNNDYRIMEDGLNSSLNSGKVVFQTQSNPDTSGIVYLTITIEHN
ncbi:hypothetical protein [Emticicia sp. BO119]|uniref:hypothetical protein n=1 Tax=Emticicia sp. BO119 TaxID=2757768 RepID=UPI0015F01460|nr:hypothetical protein [Emticicia sp. BO119]MBA4851239.1 hypothetical protein [Emticicia sp. BO119]